MHMYKRIGPLIITNGYTGCLKKGIHTTQTPTSRESLDGF